MFRFNNERQFNTEDLNFEILKTDNHIKFLIKFHQTHKISHISNLLHTIIEVDNSSLLKMMHY